MSLVSDYLKLQLATAGTDGVQVPVFGPQDKMPVFNLEMASNNIYNLLSPLMKRVFPASTKEQREYPDAVYHIASGPVQKMFQSTPIAYTTSYDVIIRDKSHANLMGLVKTIENAIESSSGYQIVDSADDYLEEENANRMGLNIEVSIPLSNDLTADFYESVIVSEEAWVADPDNWDNCTRQRIHHDVAIISTATSKAKLKMLRKQIQSKLLGWNASEIHSRMELKQGDNLQADAGLYSAVDIYTHAEWVVKDISIP